MKVALVLNGEPPGPKRLSNLGDFDAIVCADGGANALVAAGIVPTWIVGDLDSLEARHRHTAQTKGAQIVELPQRKDETDGERAFGKALELGPKEIVIFGAGGGRTSMVLANLLLLRRAREAGIEARIETEQEVFRYLKEGETASNFPVGTVLNVLAVDDPAEIRLEGTDYDDARVFLQPTSARGTSNVVHDAKARVTVLRGLVLLIVETADFSRPGRKI